ncbi:hypothetical protein [Cesiribacter sp. SM1]|uniref:hypothetical protein n=1 Tax=Cesiribacter sp. SM1 TaxID=2861196 RepID=UPI001CD6149D|nr:hypothetical protein [Cesiribacter sp. SM1]
MKKIALTLVAVAFGMGVGFAQTTPQKDLASTENTVHTLTFDNMVDRLEDGERRTISVYNLPETVMEQIKYSKLAAHTIISITEVASQSDKNSLQYELVLQESENGAADEPNLVVRYDAYGELLFQREEQAPAATAVSEIKIENAVNRTAQRKDKSVL